MTTSFLHFEQTDLELEHRERLTPFLARNPQELSGYTFATLVAWANTYHYAFNFLDGDKVLLFSYTLEPDPNRHLLQPIGALTPEVTARLLREARELPYALRIIAVGDRFMEENGALVSHFHAVE